MTEKAFAYFCYDGTGTTLLGTIPDAPPPAFGVSADGYGELSLRLPRTLAAARSDPALEPDNRVDVYVATPAALAVTAVAARYSRARYGQAVYGVTGGAHLVYRGVITTVAPSIAGADMEVRIVPLGARIASGTFVTLSASGDPVAIARQVVDSAPGLLWDSANPSAGGAAVSVEFRRTTLAQALATLRDLAGPGWFSYVTPERRVRFFCPDTTATATHRVAASRHARDGRLTYSTEGRRKAVTVVWAAGAVTAAAVDQDRTDPREEVITESAITDDGTARQLAAARLVDLDRVVVRGELTLTDAYAEIELVRPGDTVQVLTDEDTEQGAAGRYARSRYQRGRYGSAVGGAWGRAMVIAAAQYRYREVHLELAEPAPRQSAKVRATLEQAARFAAAHGDTQLTRNASGQLAAREALSVPSLAADGAVAAASLSAATAVSVGGVTIDPTATHNPPGGTQAAPTGWADPLAEAWASALLTKLQTANIVS